MPEYQGMKKDELIRLLEDLQEKLRSMEAVSEPRRLLHELQVHQVELEMQNRELREARAEIEEARDRYAELYDFAPVGYLTLDEKGDVTDINLTGASMLGKERLNILGRPFFSHIDRKDVSPLMRALRECREKGVKEIAEVGLLKDGTMLHVQAVCLPAVDTRTGWKVVRAAIIDISERKRVEALSVALAGEQATRAESEKARKKVEESEATYRAVGETIPFGIWIAGADGGIEYLSRSFLDLVGSSLDECRGAGWMERLPGQEIERVRREWEDCIKGGRLCDLEYMLKGVDNRLHYILSRGIPIRDANGRIVRWAGLNIDMTGRKEIEEALSSERERLSVTLRSIAEGVITLNNDGTVFFMNKEAEKITGWDQKDVQGRIITEVLDVADPVTGKRVDPLSSFERVGKAGFYGDLVMVDKAGYQKPVTGKVSSISDGAGRKTGDVIVFSDITVRKRFEEEILKTRKLESLGALASGIANEFANLLTAIKGNIELAMEETPGKYAKERLLEAERVVDAVKILSRQLRTYVTGVKPLREIAYIDDILNDSIELAFKDSNIMYVTRYPESKCCFVDVDEEQIRQAFYNILYNAREAVPENGLVEISAELVDIGIGDGLPLKEGKYIKTTIKDTGPGMPQENLRKIFDPFFTTKASKMGLGLTIVFSIVKNHDGLITVESELGKGTAFHVYLPATRIEKRGQIPEKQQLEHM